MHPAADTTTPSSKYHNKDQEARKNRIRHSCKQSRSLTLCSMQGRSCEADIQQTRKSQQEEAQSRSGERNQQGGRNIPHYLQSYWAAHDPRWSVSEPLLDGSSIPPGDMTRGTIKKAISDWQQLLTAKAHDDDGMKDHTDCSSSASQGGSLSKVVGEHGIASVVFSHNQGSVSTATAATMGAPSNFHPSVNHRPGNQAKLLRLVSSSEEEQMRTEERSFSHHRYSHEPFNRIRHVPPKSGTNAVPLQISQGDLESRPFTKVPPPHKYCVPNMMEEGHINGHGCYNRCGTLLEHQLHNHHNFTRHFDNGFNASDHLPRPFHPATGCPTVIVPSLGPILKRMKDDFREATPPEPQTERGYRTLGVKSLLKSGLTSKCTSKLDPHHSPMIGTVESSLTQSLDAHGHTMPSSDTINEGRRRSVLSSKSSSVSNHSQMTSIQAFLFFSRKGNNALMQHQNCSSSRMDQSKSVEDPEKEKEREVSPSSKAGSGGIIASTDSNMTMASKGTTSNSKQNVPVRRDITISKAVKPLNAYNYFYAEIRHGILQLSNSEQYRGLLPNNQQGDQDKDTLRNRTIQPGLLASTIILNQNAILSKDERKRWLLSKHWNKDRNTRRTHRTKHGKFSFSQMNDLVSSEWRHLSIENKAFYKDVANTDRKRYQEQKRGLHDSKES